MLSSGAEAFLATLVISSVPNLILYLIPDSFVRWERGLDYMLCFAAGALLGDVEELISCK